MDVAAHGLAKTLLWRILAHMGGSDSSHEPQGDLANEVIHQFILVPEVVVNEGRGAAVPRRDLANRMALEALYRNKFTDDRQNLAPTLLALLLPLIHWGLLLVH